jgi:hypothetical protein
MAGDSSHNDGARTRGAWVFDDDGGRRLEEAERAGAGPLRDVAVDGAGRVWMLGEQGLLQFDPAVQRSTTTDSAGGEAESDPTGV